MDPGQTYTISEAAALTGLHRNTIRQRIRLGTLKATVRQGKFGEEYRISHPALVEAGLLQPEGPLSEGIGPRAGIRTDRSLENPDLESGASCSRIGTGSDPEQPAWRGLSSPRSPGFPTSIDPEQEAPDSKIHGSTPTAPSALDDPVLEARIIGERETAGEETARSGSEADGELVRKTLSSLTELYQRHEQAMFRLGYVQSELEQVKALAETAESLRQGQAAQEEEMHSLRTALQEKERQLAEAEAVRKELSDAQERLREMEALRQDIEQLKGLASRQEETITALEETRKRPWWRFW